MADIVCDFLFLSQYSNTMSERILTHKALMEADLDQHSVELQAEVHRESILSARVEVRMLRLICFAIDIVGRPAEMPVRLMLSCGLILSFFQIFRLSADGAADGHAHWEPHIALLHNFFSTQFLPLAESPRMVDDIVLEVSKASSLK